MVTWTRAQEIALINQTQDEYVESLSEVVFAPFNITDSEYAMKFVSINSPTGTGKTKMMAKFINKHPDCFFLITTLSRGQLNRQVAASLKRDCIHDNFCVFGAMQLTKNTLLREQDIINIINDVPANKKVIWFRDEGHIRTNKWSSILEDRCFKIVNWSATNRDASINCNFMHTMMLRTVQQEVGSIYAALMRLKEVKAAHAHVPHYNPCAVFRVRTQAAEDAIKSMCEEMKFQCITLVDNSNFNMQQLCKDDDTYDVVINKMKIVEGVDMRRAHVLWLERRPKNITTLIQFIGRALRNALLWREDIDILSPDHKTLLENTRQAHVFYNVATTDDEEIDDELLMTFCPYISVQRLKPDTTIYVENGTLANGLKIMELENQTGYYHISLDDATGFNIIDFPDVYQEKTQYHVSQKFKETIDAFNAWLPAQPPTFCTTFKKTLEQYYRNGRIVLNEWTSPTHNLRFTGDVDSNGYPKLHSPECGSEHAPSSIFPIDPHIYEMSHSCDITLHFADKALSLTGEEWLCALQHQRIDYQFLHQDRFQTKSEYTSITNNELLAVLGIDYCRPVGENGRFGWCEERAITSKVSRFSKLNEYITRRFKKELSEAEQQCFTGSNHFDFPARLNNILGQLVEDYGKYLAYGNSYLQEEMFMVHAECKKLHASNIPQHIKIIRACLLKQANQAKAQGAKARMTISLTALTHASYAEFVNIAHTYGTRVGDFLVKHLNVRNASNTCHELHTDHIVGVMDACDGETIIDIKMTGHINLTMVKQVLAYYWLSPSLSKMKISKVMVYDVTSNRFISIQLPVQQPWSIVYDTMPRQWKLTVQPNEQVKAKLQDVAGELSAKVLQIADSTIHSVLRNTTLSSAEMIYGYPAYKLSENERAKNTYDIYSSICVTRDNRFQCPQKGQEALLKKVIQHLENHWHPHFFDFVSPQTTKSGINQMHRDMASILRPLVELQFPEIIDNSQTSDIHHLRLNFEYYRLIFSLVQPFDLILSDLPMITIQDYDNPCISRFVSEENKAASFAPSAQQPRAQAPTPYKHNFYVVAKGRNPGIYPTWNACKNEVDKFPGAIFKRFGNITEAEDYYAEFNDGYEPYNPEYLELKRSVS